MGRGQNAMQKKKYLCGTATVRGKSHIRLGIVNQDCVIFNSKKNLLTLAMADGLGSHPHSEKGSRAVCEAAAKTAEIFSYGTMGREDAFLTMLTYSWRQMIYPLEPNECGTTCLVMVRFPNRDIFLAQLGDGEIVYEYNGIVRVLKEKEDEFADLTHSVSSSHLSDWDKITLTNVTKGFSLYMHTDGLSILKDKRGYFLSQLNEKLYGINSQSRADRFLLSLLQQSWEGELDDDRTIAYFRLK